MVKFKICDVKIVVTTDGNTTTAKKYHGKTVVATATAKCNPDDKFNFDKGAKIAVDRLLGADDVSEDNYDGFKVGDIVRVINNGLCYTNYVDWVAGNVKDIIKAVCFKFNEIPANNDNKYKIITLAKHDVYKDRKLAYIQNLVLKECYLIEVEGLKKC